MTRRDVLKAMGVLAGALGRAADRLPANKNVKWGLGSNLWNSFKGSKFTDILDVEGQHFSYSCSTRKSRRVQGSVPLCLSLIDDG